MAIGRTEDRDTPRDLKWTPDLGPLLKVWSVCSVATDGAINDEITQEI